MKFRPQIIIRCRGVDQFEAVQRMASEAEFSVNEWILRQLEAANPVLVEPKTVKPKAKGK